MLKVFDGALPVARLGAGAGVRAVVGSGVGTGAGGVLGTAAASTLAVLETGAGLGVAVG